MKPLTLFLSSLAFLVWSNTILAQDAFKNAIQLELGLDMSYRLRTIGPGKLRPIGNLSKSDFINYLDSLEKASWGNRLGISYQRNLGKNFALKAGIQFSTLRYKINFGADTLYAPPNTYFIDAYTLNYEYSFFQIPITIIYYIGKKKARMSIEAGITTMYLYAAKESSPQDWVESKNTISYFRKYNFGAHLALGLHYQINPRFAFITQIKGNMHLMDLQKGRNPFELRLMSLGLDLGFSIGF